MENTKAFNRIASIATPYMESEKELAKRVNFVKTVIQNTLRKFPTELHPEELAWVKSGSSTRITGFDFRDRNDAVKTERWQKPSENKVAAISADNPINKKHVLTFYIIGKKSWSSDELTVRQASIPAELLFNDPMAIAQYARKLVRAKQTRLRMEQSSNAQKKLDEVTKQIEKLEQDRAKLEQEKVEIRRRSQQARDVIAKNREKAEKRKVAKLLKADS